MINQTAPDQNLREPQELFASGSDDKISSGAAVSADGQHSGNGALAVGDWREIARRIEKETDSKVMIDLIQQLIARLDAENVGKKFPSRDE